MEEHSPAPQESRGIYGFVMFMGMNLCILFYFLWMLMPLGWFDSWPYEPPQPYWGLAVPVYFCTALFLFAFCIYPAMHSRYDSELNDSSIFTDEFSHPPDHFKSGKEVKSKKKSKVLNVNDQHSNPILSPISPVSDLDLHDVSQNLYLEK